MRRKIFSKRERDCVGGGRKRGKDDRWGKMKRVKVWEVCQRPSRGRERVKRAERREWMSGRPLEKRPGLGRIES